MTYSEKKFSEATTFILGVVLIFILITITSSYFSLRDSTKYGMVFVFMLGFLYYPLNTRIIKRVRFFLDPLMDKNFKQADSAKRGFRGENEVNSWLEGVVGKENIIRNIQFEDCNFDIDLVAVGNKGIFVLEVKNPSNQVYFENDDYFYEDKNGRRLLSSFEDPRSEARRHTNSLKNYLNNYGIDSTKFNTIVAFANGKVNWEGKSGIYIAKNKESLETYISKLEPDPKCTPEVCEKIKELLKKHSKF